MKIKVLVRSQSIYLAIIIIFAAGLYAAKAIPHLFIELRISTSGEEVPAKILKIETVDQDNGDQSWTVDLINYSFEVPEGYTFTGINEANTSQTIKLIGAPDASGVYKDAKVEYFPRNPEWNRLKGWGYRSYGPPGGYGSFAARFALHFVILFAALAYAYRLLSSLPSRKV